MGDDAIPLLESVENLRSKAAPPPDDDPLASHPSVVLHEHRPSVLIAKQRAFRDLQGPGRILCQPIEDGTEEVLFAADVSINRPLAYPGLGGHVRHDRATVSLAGENPKRCLRDVATPRTSGRHEPE
jgi:hypothetical protein